MTDTSPSRTFHDPDPTLDDPVAAAWFTAMNRLAFTIMAGAETAAEARAALDVYSTGEVDGLIPSVITDHGGLSGLTDDDHTQYTLADGTRAFTGDQSFGGNEITNAVLDSFTNNVNADDVHLEVRNSTGAALSAGEMVYVSGYNVGQNLVEVALADASDAAKMPAIGIVQTGINNNENGSIVLEGIANNLDTSSFSVGDILYVSAATPGALVNTRPAAPNEVQAVAQVVRSNASTGALVISSGFNAFPPEATTAEMQAGTETAERTMTPALVKDAIDEQALTSPVITGTINEDVYALSGTTPDIDPANGAIQTWTLSGNSTPTESLTAGDSVTLMINDGAARTITWTAVDQWIGGSAPTLPTTGYALVEIFKVGSTVYGVGVGDFS